MITSSPARAATVFIVDDDEHARTALHRLMTSHDLRTELFPSAEAFLSRLPVDVEGCLLLDQHMPGMSGLELLQALQGTECRLPVVFLTGHADIRSSVKAIKLGAEDFLPKLADEIELLDAIERSLKRCRQRISEAEARRYARQSAESLTQRELQVCQFVVAGRTNGQIAEQLGITERTVKAHRAKVMEKFEVTTLADLVRHTQVAGIEIPD